MADISGRAKQYERARGATGMMNSRRTQQGYSWSDMTVKHACEVVARIRQLAATSGSIEQFVQETMEELVNLFRTGEGARSEIVLARCFLTHRAERSDMAASKEIEWTRGMLSGGLGQCLVLVGSASEAGEGNAVGETQWDGEIQVSSPQLAARHLMIAAAFRQMGVNLTVEPEQLVSDSCVGGGSECNVFMIPIAKGNPYMSAQSEFVERYGITSVLGCVGPCYDGQHFVVVLLLRVPLYVVSVHLSRLFALAVQLGLVLVSERTRGIGQSLDTVAWEELCRVYEATICTQRRNLQAKEQEVARLAERVITEQDEERARIARELHDHVVSRLGGIGFVLQTLAHVPPESKEEMAASLEGLMTEVETLRSATRAVARHLHSVGLDREGITAALNRLLDEMERRQMLCVTRGIAQIRQTVAPHVSATLYRVAEEALQNIVKHAGVQVCHVNLIVRDGVLELMIADQGRGLAMRDGQAVKPGLGFVSMTERVRQIQGALHIESAMGHGTVITVRVPILADQGMEACHGASGPLR
ncbi:MAG: sensor histidine kinase [Nitrospira sp.]|nr:sensor histidine kinase [Nitrospira sp.]